MPTDNKIQTLHYHIIILYFIAVRVNTLTQLVQPTALLGGGYRRTPIALELELELESIVGAIVYQVNDSFIHSIQGNYKMSLLKVLSKNSSRICSHQKVVHDVPCSTHCSTHTSLLSRGKKSFSTLLSTPYQCQAHNPKPASSSASSASSTFINWNKDDYRFLSDGIIDQTTSSTGIWRKGFKNETYTNFASYSISNTTHTNIDCTINTILPLRERRSTNKQQHRHFSVANSKDEDNNTTIIPTTNNNNNNKSNNEQNVVHDAMNKRYLFQYLKLKTYSNEEIDEAFNNIIKTTSVAGQEQGQEQQSNDDQNEYDSNQSHATTMNTINEQNLTAFVLDRITQIDKKQQLQQHEQSSPKDFIKNESYSEEKQKAMKEYANNEAKRMILLLNQNNNIHIHNNNEIIIQQQQQHFIMDKTTFQEQIRNLATKIDTGHTLPIAVSMLLVGSSVGIVIPIMPYVVSNLGLSAGQYGMVVSSFAFAKLFANVPAAVFVEKHGRKPHLVYSLIIISAGVGGIGLASQFEHLVLCRVLTGIGVSSLSTAATLANADASTPLNRASTMAPMMSAFAAGTALGPVMGGVLADRVGIQSTFYLVGCIYLALTAVNKITLNETKLPSLKERQLPWHVNNSNDISKTDDGEKDESIIGAMKDATSQWLPLLQIESVRNVVLMNGFYWIALSGSQMTLLPLILTNPDGLAFTATQVGQGKFW